MIQSRNKTLRVLVDMDMVLCDFESHLLAEFRKKHPELPYIPLNERKGFYVKDQYHDSFGPESSEKIRNIYSRKGFFQNLPEITGACQAIQEMSNMNGVDVYICSSPMISCNTCLTEKASWIQRNLNRKWVEKLILVKDKTLINADVLIDDKPEITGVNSIPNWEHVVFTACHNIALDIGGKKRLNGWIDGSWKKLISSFLDQMQMNHVDSTVNAASVNDEKIVSLF
ncbi:hypothetical protein BsWGS_20432 [Bradybaena similaris]